MSRSNQQVVSPRWLLMLLAVAAITVALLAPAGASAFAGPAPLVRVVRTGPTLDDFAVGKLTVELQEATASFATMIVIVPASPRLAQSVGPQQLARLALASEGGARLVFVGGPGDVLPAFRRNGVRFTDYRSAKALEAHFGDAKGVDQGTLSVGPLASLLASPNKAGGGHGLPIMILLVAGLVLSAIALAGRVLYARSRGGRRPTCQTLLSPVPAGTVRAGTPWSPRPPASRASRRPQFPPDARLPTSGAAVVRSELHPDGYVELGSCLRRVRWAQSRIAPPAPGEWVDVQVDNGRLLAFPSRHARNGRQR
jgi:hypothetical protein